MEIFTLFNTTMGTATLLMQISLVFLVILYIKRHDVFEKFLVRFALWLAFCLSLVATVLTLVYSEYFGIVPCSLCWIGRIFLYPQVVLFGIAAYKKDMHIALYSIVLSIFGLLVALYTHYLQMGGDSILPCPASGVTDCAKRYVFEFGYITLPLIGATMFAFLIVVMLFVLRSQKEATK